jgi:hypothetical protein
MGSDDEIMIHRFMEEEAATDTDEEEHIEILMGLLRRRMPLQYLEGHRLGERNLSLDRDWRKCHALRRLFLR